MDLMNKTIEDTADEPFELLIVYSQVLISKKGEVNYMQMWDSDYVDDFASISHTDVLSMRLHLQAPIPSDTSSADLHWAYYEKCDALIANANAGQISLATAYVLIMGGDYLETDNYDDPSTKSPLLNLKKLVATFLPFKPWCTTGCSLVLLHSQYLITRCI